MVYLAGQIGLVPETGEMIGDDPGQQTKQVLANIAAVLAGCGLSPADIVLTTIFLNDISHGAVVNELYEKFVNSDAPPARQTVAVRALPMGAAVEISVIAARPE